MANIVIIGAGLTGLSAAYHLEQRNYFDYTMFEKESSVGGLCRSVQQDGFTFDFTGHLLHVSDAYLRDLIERVVGFQHLHTITRQSYVFSENTYTRYPYQSNLYGLPEQTIVDCIEGYAQRKKTRKKPQSFHAWVLHYFGKGIAEHFFFPFQKKIFAYKNLHDISSTWMGRFVPQTSLQRMIKGALYDIQDEAIGYNSSFFYPKQGGIQFWIDRLADQVNKHVHTGYTVTNIDIAQQQITFSNGHTQSYDILINTMPLDALLRCIKEPAHMNIKSATDKLLCNSVVNFNLGIARHDLSDKHWIYVPEKEYPFYRIGFPHNFAPSAVPEGCSSLYGEFSHLKSSPRSLTEKLRASKQAVQKLLRIEPHDIVTEKIIHIPHAYVLYTHWREKNLPALLAQLAAHNIHSVGRYGAWKYSSMQEAVLDGKKIAEIVTVLPAQKAYQESLHQPIAPKKERELR